MIQDQVIDKQKIAKTAGIAYLITFIIVVTTNFVIYDRLVIKNNVIETARSIQMNEYLFRVGMIADIIYAIGFTILLSSLLYLLVGVNNRFLTLAAFFHFIYIATWVVFTLKALDTMRFANEAPYLQGFNQEQLASFTNLLLKNRFDRYYGGLMFYSLGSVIFNFLWLESRFIPKYLAVVGIIACVWCLFCSVAYLLYPPFSKVINVWLFDIPMAMYDIILSICLISNGVNLNSKQVETTFT